MFNNKIIPIFLWVLILQGCNDVEVIVEGNGRVYDVVGEENINCGSGAGEDKCKNSYGTGVDSVTFKAEPDSGYRLKTWGNSCKADVCSSVFLEGIPELLKVAFEKVPTEISYIYNASGQRVSKTVDGDITFFIYQLDGSLLAELDVNGNTLVDYIYLEGKPIAQVRPQSSGAGDTAYIHADHLGAPKAATNQSGEVIWQVKTTPFGEVYSETGTLAQNQRFPGQYADNESNYSYNYFRDYDPSTGRYIQSDPIGLRGGLNTYAYAGSNPIMYIDPYGLDFGFTVNPAAAGGNGHTTLHFQDGNGNWYTYDQGAAGNTSSGEGSTGMLLGGDAPAGVGINQMNPLIVKPPSNAVVYKTTPEQDAQIANSAANSAREHNSGRREYNLYNNNCTDAATDVINDSNADINVPNSPFTVKPNTWIKEL